MVINRLIFKLFVLLLLAKSTDAVDCGQKYTVQPGDNCYAISQKYGLDNSAFMQANKIPPDCKNLQVDYILGILMV